MPILLLIAIIALGGASFNAESALPGDTLYPVKVNVNEKMRTWLAIGDEADAYAHGSIAGHRLDEAQKLLEQNMFTGPVRTTLEAGLTDEIGKVRERLMVLRAEGQVQQAAAVEADIKAKLGERADILKRLNTQFNPENLDSFASGRTIGMPVPVETGPSATSTATTTFIEISAPVVETSTTSEAESGP